VPRQKPRAEQLIRASRARKFGLAQLLTIDHAREPQIMSASLQELMEASAPFNLFETADMGGLAKIVSLTQNLLAQKAA